MPEKIQSGVMQQGLLASFTNVHCGGRLLYRAHLGTTIGICQQEVHVAGIFSISVTVLKSFILEFVKRAANKISHKLFIKHKCTINNAISEYTQNGEQHGTERMLIRKVSRPITYFSLHTYFPLSASWQVQW